MNCLLYLFTAILYIFSYPNFIFIRSGFPSLAWLCLIPFIIAVNREKKISSLIICSYLCGLFVFLGGMSWLTEVTWLGYAGLSMYMAVYFILFGVCCHYFKNIFILAVAWTALEFIRSRFGGGIPWLLLGGSQYNNISLIQISDITGVYGISFIIAMVNAKFARSPLKWKGWVLIVCVLSAVFFYGKYQIQTPTEGEKYKIGIVQPNIPLEIKWDAKYTNWMVDRLILLSQDTIPCDILIWPETSVPKLIESVAIRKQLEFTAKNSDYNLILGTQGVDEEKKYYNSAVLISSEGRIENEYRKIHLVPFGEYVPFEKHIPFLNNLTPIQEGFSPGSEYTVFDVEGVKLAVLICFEDVLPGLSRRFVRKGARILVNITNDAWFGKSEGPYQHAFLSVFRAVENNMPLVRSANTGISCFIDNHGRITDMVQDEFKNELMVKGCMARNIIVPGAGGTFYTKYGDIFGWGCVVILMGLMGIKLRRLLC